MVFGLEPDETEFNTIFVVPSTPILNPADLSIYQWTIQRWILLGVGITTAICIAQVVGILLTL